MEFIQAFNPLYAVPIVAVIFCAFIVYAFGFKSPVQPPSFHGIEEEKKISKKRRAKESQKSNKLLQNGKSNSSSVKNAVSSSKKKDVSEKVVASEKSSNLEKISNLEKNAVEKKASKKNKLPNEKKSQQEKKRESLSHDDLNDDGWVQLVSKKGRKNKKRDDHSVSETQSNTAISKTGEVNKSDDSSQVEESPKRTAEVQDSSFNQKEPTPAAAKINATKEDDVISNIEKPKVQNVMIEVPKLDTSIEKQPSKEATPKGAKVLEESNKSKKKKKKSLESNLSENESLGKIKSNILDSSAVHVSEIPAPQEITNSTPTINDFSQVTGKVDLDPSSEIKSSNVAFDELAGLYPETKEQQKKKKKVRRDH